MVLQGVPGSLELLTKPKAPSWKALSLRTPAPGLPTGQRAAAALGGSGHGLSAAPTPTGA